MKYRQIAILLLLALVMLPGLSHAKPLTYQHDGEPLFSIAFPDGWYVDTDYASDAKAAGASGDGEPEIRILEAMPGDGTKLWFGIWTAPKTTTLERGLEYVASLDGSLFTNVESSEPKETTLSGMAATTFHGTAKRENEDVEYAVAVFEPQAGVIVVALYVGRPHTWEKHKDDLEGIVDSLKPVGD